MLSDEHKTLRLPFILPRRSEHMTYRRWIASQTCSVCCAAEYVNQFSEGKTSPKVTISHAEQVEYTTLGNSVVNYSLFKTLQTFYLKSSLFE